MINALTSRRNVLAPLSDEGSEDYGVDVRIAHLTERERQVLSLLAEGMTQAEVGSTLRISPMTVRVHVGHCCVKLKARNSLHAVVLAQKNGLIAI